MSWTDALALAAKGVSRRFGRAVLTVLAVALAACLLTALVTIASTAQNEVLRQIVKGGPLASIKVAAAEPDPAELANDNADPGEAKDLDATAVQRIRNLPDVDSVVPLIASRMIFTPPPALAKSLPQDDDEAAATYFFDTTVGADMSQADKLPVTLLAGRLPAAGSLTEIAVTQGYLERLGLDVDKPEVVLGSELEMGPARVFSELGDQPYRALWRRAGIVGVVAQEAAPGQVLAPIELTRMAAQWTAQSDEGASLDIPTSPYSGLVVVADGLNRIGKVREQITAVGYSTSAPENLIASVQRYLRVVEIVLSAVGAIALVIASLGISNALLAAVRERRREIGVLKAIGARDRDVLRIFLMEASMHGFIGGAIGSVAGYIVARSVGAVVNGYLASEGLLGVEMRISAAVWLGGIAGSTLLALVAGATPALRAARLPAREAIGE